MQFPRISTICEKLISKFKDDSPKKLLTCTIDCCEKKSIAYESTTSIDLTIGLQEYESIVCTLTEPQFARRKNELQRDVFSRIRNIKEVETGFLFVFPYHEQFLIKMTEYIIAEKKCCPFFTFEIKLAQTDSILLKITGPLESKKMLETFLVEYN